MTARNFVWLSIGGGAWSLGANWADTTDGISPSLVPPGAGDSVTIAGPSGAAMQTITGPATGYGQAVAALFTGNTLLSGSFSIASLVLGQIAVGGLLELAAGTALASGTADVVSGSLLVGGGASFAVSGAMTLGDAGQGTAAALNVTGLGGASVMSVFMASPLDSIYVDPASVLEVGGTGAGRAGQLTIDAGGVLSGQGNANAYGAVANNGTISAVGGTLAVGRLSGTGALAIGDGATLLLNAACGAGQSVAFIGAGATLALAAEFYAPAGLVSGFSVGDGIDVRGSPISQATWQASGASGGVLTLFYGGQVADRFQLAGNYAGEVFLTSGDGAGGTLITLAAGASGGGKPSPGTATPDNYVWIGGAAGRWNSTANWSDTTRNQAVAGIPPGVNNLVSIAAGQDTFTVIAGPANAAALSLVGEVALSGAFAIGNLTVGQASGVAGTLDLLGGTAMGTANAAIADGAISVAGSGSVLSVAGTLALGGGMVGVGLPTTALSVASGGVVLAAGLTLGGGSGDSVVTDPTGIVEIGAAGGAVAGAVTVDAGAALSGNGSVNPLGTIVDNGSVLASGGTLSLGAVSGLGTLLVAAGGTMELLGATSCRIGLQGIAASGAVLEFANARVAPAGTITGFVPGDVIRLEGSSLTGAVFTQATGVLVLSYGSTVVARLSLAGSFLNEKFVLTPDGANGTLISVAASTGPGGNSGQAGTDTLSWVSPVSGGWSRSFNWTDVTIGALSTAPPGPQTPVQIAGPVGTAFATVTGTGTCASLSTTGDIVLSGSFSTGQLGLGAGATLVVSQATSLQASGAGLEAASLVVSGTGAAVSVAGTLSLTGAASLLASQDKAGVQVGGLSLGGTAASVGVDATAWMDVGGTAFTALGAVTIDAGAQVGGSGNVNLAGGIVDNGSLVAAGGTLWLGSVTGSGGLAIQAEATLALTAGDTCPIAFAGGGATLLLAGTALAAGTISGFAAGDAIVIGNTPADSVAFALGSDGLGTLTIGEAGRTIGHLVLAGAYAGSVFGVQPSGTGAAITVQPQGPGYPPAGTVTPDSYVWLGGQGAAWSAAGNWADSTLGQNPAAVAPGLNDAVLVAGGVGVATRISGPADAARLSLSGTVALQGGFAVGTLSVGTAQGDGLLALAGGATLEAGLATVAGGVAVGGGGAFVVDTVLTLGAAGRAGALAATGGGLAEFGAVSLMGVGSTLSVDAGTAVEIGGRQGAAAGTITIDAGGVLSGAGLVGAGSGGLGGAVVDQGTITASGGTLALGDVSGGGLLVVGLGATLALEGSASAALNVDFAGGGTLSLGAGALGGGALGVGALAASPAIAGFGTGDAIVLQTGSAADSAHYVQTAPGVGTVFIDNAGQVIAQLMLLGDASGLAFSVAGSAGGATILTAAPDKKSAPGGGFVTNPTTSGSTTLTLYDLVSSLRASLPYAADALSAFRALNTEVVEWYSVDGVYLGQDGLPVDPSKAAPANVSSLVGVEVIGPLPGQTGQGNGPDFVTSLQAGYGALLLQGTENASMTDAGLGNALLVGNYGHDQIAALGDGDTLVGATGANTTFYAALSAGAQTSATGYDVTIIGGGNDTIATNSDAASISTGANGHSQVFLGSPQNSQTGNSVRLNGSDTVICGGVGGVLDNVTVAAAAGLGGSVVFGAPNARLNLVGGNTASTVVGNGGQIVMQGGAANGSVVWGGDAQSVTYIGGAGSAAVIGGSGQTLVQGGSGPVTVFGGTGQGLFRAVAPGSVLVVGTGATTVEATSGVSVYVSGAAPVSVAGGDGAFVYAGSSSGNDIFQASAGSETLWGGVGNDLFLTGGGHELLVSGGGNDVFSFTNGLAGGSDTISGFVIGQDMLKLEGYGPAPPPITYAFGDSILNLTDGTQIVVYNVANLTAASITTV